MRCHGALFHAHSVISWFGEMAGAAWPVLVRFCCLSPTTCDPKPPSALTMGDRPRLSNIWPIAASGRDLCSPDQSLIIVVTRLDIRHFSESGSSTRYDVRRTWRGFCTDLVKCLHSAVTTAAVMKGLATNPAFSRCYARGWHDQQRRRRVSEG